MDIKRGDIYWANISPVIGSEQGGLRPVLIIQNDVGNRHSPCTIVVPITSRRTKTQLPTHVEFVIPTQGVISTVLCEHIRTVDKQRLGTIFWRISESKMKEVDKALAISIGLD